MNKFMKIGTTGMLKVNLQTFAAPTYGNMTNEQRVKWEKEVGIAFREEPGLSDDVDMPMTLPKHEGDTVNYRILTVDTSDAVVPEGAELPEGSLDVSKVEVTAKKYGGKIKLTDELMRFAIDDLRTLAAPEIGKNYKEVAEKLAFAEAITSTNQQFVGGVANANAITASNVFTYKEAVKIGRIMRENHIPKVKLSNGKMGYKAYITPILAERVLNDETWIKFNQFKGDKSETGTVGIINNVEFIDTTFVPVVDNSSSVKVAKVIVKGTKCFGGVKPEGKSGVDVWYTSPEVAAPADRNKAFLSALMWDAYGLLRDEGVMVYNVYNG